ncbi:MAG TPA: GAF domain-containing protein, partial [Gemmatimonadales bacterium]|nr:GAF domain-containing protein [Gemmatimonadales bacterium]
VLDAAMGTQRADFGNIQLYDRETGTLAIVVHRGFSQAFLDYFARVDAHGTSACGQALKSSARIIIEDVTTDPSYAPHRAIAAAAGYRAVQSTPLIDPPVRARRSGCCRPIFAVTTGHRAGICP